MLSVRDYGRTREIHVEKSLDVIKFDLEAINLSHKEIEEFDGFKKIEFCNSEYFGVEKVDIFTEWKDESNIEKFFILTCVEGNGVIEGKNFSEKIKKGDSFLIPASLGEYTVKGKVAVLKSYPN